MKKHFIKILNISLIFFVIIVLLVICKNKRNDIKKLGEEEYKVITSEALTPTEKAKSGLYLTIRVTSSSRQILSCIVAEIPSYFWTNPGEIIDDKMSVQIERKKIKSMVGGYYVDIPVSSLKTIEKFDFSGVDLGNLTLLPDFSIWPALQTLDFSYCNITDVSGFTKSSYFKYIKSIDLRGNNIQNPPTSVVKDNRFNLKTQIFAINSGTTQKNSKLMDQLPSIFTKSYADLQPPKSYEKNINCKTINGAAVTLDTSKVGTHSASVKITDSNSRFYGSTAYFTYTVNEKGTNNINNNNGDNNYNYQEPILMKLNANSYSPGGYAKSKNITITLTGENVDTKKAIIYVNNQKITNNNGKGIYTATKNGAYQIVVTYPGLNNIVFQHTLSGIDTSRPTYIYNTKMNTGSNVKHLTIVAKDNCAIKYISVNGINLYRYDEKTAYSQFVVNFKVAQSGNYKIKVVDIAGNAYEKTEQIEIDNMFPHFEKITVTKEGGDEKIVFSSDVYDACRVKLGDKIIINIKPDEEIVGYKDIYLNGISYGLDNVIYMNKTIIIEVELTQEIIDKYKMNGNVKVSIVDIKDKYGNKGTVSKGKVFYLDSIPPQIKQVTITGGTLSRNQQAIEIYKGQTITVSAYVTEALNGYPLINVAGYTRFATCEGSNFDIDGVNCYKYTVPITTDILIKNLKKQGIENDFIPIQIKNWVDHAGLPIEEIIIDENNKSSNGVCLVYGKVKTGELFFAGIQQVNMAKGDINGDGYINRYDYLLMARHLSQIEELADEQKKYADIDGKDSIDKKDLIELSNMINQRENEILKDTSVTLKVYDENNTQLTGENLKFEIEEGANLVTINNDQDTITITPNGESGNITIKANYFKGDGYEEQIGRMRFIIGKLNLGDGAFEIISENKNNRKILGDINEDGFITNFDSIIIQEAVAKYIELTDEQQELGDIIKDDEINILDVTAVKTINSYNYNGIKIGDRIKLRFNSAEGEKYNDLQNSSIENQIVWYTKENTDMVTINPNDYEGTAEIIINENAEPGTKITVACRVKLSDEYEETAEFNIEVLDKAEVNLTNKELECDLSNLEESDIIIGASTNLANREIYWKSSNEDIVKIEVDEYGNAKVMPLKSGQSEISATVDGITETCTVKVIESIKNIAVKKQSINIKETQEEEIEIELEPITATESPIVISNNGNIAKVYKDEETGAHKVVGVAKGTTTIEVSCPSDQEIKQTIEVNVVELSTPSIKSITINQEEEEKLYGIGEKLNIKFTFTDMIKGDVPSLNIKFGDYTSAGKTKFVGFEDNNTAIAYEYTVEEGDNGVLVIDNLEGGTLKDETEKLDAILTATQYYYEEDSIQQAEPQEELFKGEISNFDENPKTSEVDTINNTYLTNVSLLKAVSNESEYKETQNNTEEVEVVSDGINRVINAVKADTTKPKLTVEAYVDKNSCWLKSEDVAKISIISSEELKQAPTVIMGGFEAIVEGEGTEFTASLLVTEDLEEGYLEVKVKGYEDFAGNVGEEVTAKEENINEPIIIDNSETIIKSVELIKEDGKEYVSGEQFKIRVTFADKTIDRVEYISASEMPKIGIRFGENEAQGKLESDYVVGEYVDSIIYTYTISEKDSGKLSINGIEGTIVDVAGNETDLSKIEELPKVAVINVDSNNESDNNNNDDAQTGNGQGNYEGEEEKKDSNKTEKLDGKYDGILPKTGSTIISILIVCLGGSAVISGISYILLKRKNI